MPVFLKDAHGLDTFACDCCGKVYPRISMHEHHKIKQAMGGKDTRANIAILDAHCHHALHQIEAAVKNEKKRLYVPEMLRRLYPDNQKAREICLYLAMTAAMGEDKQNPDNKAAEEDWSIFDTDDLVTLTPPRVPPKIRDLVNRVVAQLKGPDGKKAGVSTYLRWLVEADLRKRGFKLDQPKKNISTGLGS